MDSEALRRLGVEHEPVGEGQETPVQAQDIIGNDRIDGYGGPKISQPIISSAST